METKDRKKLVGRLVGQYFTFSSIKSTNSFNPQKIKKKTITNQIDSHIALRFYVDHEKKFKIQKT